MVCKNCGTQNEPNAVFCRSCGADLREVEVQTPVTPEPTYAAYNGEPYNGEPYTGEPVGQTSEPGKGMAIASMVLGIVSFFCFGIITAPLAIIFGGVAKSKGYKGGMATAGIVCGAVGLGILLFSWIFCGAMYSEILTESLMYM